VRTALGVVLTFGSLAGCAPRPGMPAREPLPTAPSAPVASVVATATAPAPSAPAASVVASTTAPAPPVGMSALPVDGFETATISFPAGSPKKAPLLVVAHGAGDTPDALCRTFRDIVGERGVILCPAGPRRFAYAEGRYFPDHPKLERIVLASVESLLRAYPAYVDGTSATYVGYSQGAMMGALMIPAHGAEFPRLILVEGGSAEWSPEHAALFRMNGGRRVLFACGRPKCQTDARETARLLGRTGLETRVVLGSGGHTFQKGVAQAVRGEFDWVVSDDPRWSALAEQASERHDAKPALLDAREKPR
jgi:predicted esterase